MFYSGHKYLYYKYLNHKVCPLMPSRWMQRNIQDLSDWVSEVITGREEPYNPWKDKLAVIEKISSHQPYTTIIKDLKNKLKWQKLNLDLSIRVDIQQLVIGVNSYLRNLITQYKDVFNSDRQFSHCSIFTTRTHWHVNTEKLHHIVTTLIVR